MASTLDASPLHLRHIEDHNEANTTLIRYWGYADRVRPCTKDAGTCEYLDAVYAMHRTSMVYTFILWGVLLGISLLWLVVRGWRQGEVLVTPMDRMFDRFARLKRKLLLRDVDGVWRRWVFGRVSRVQVVVLGCLLAYILVFSLVGITYKTWITPVSGTSLHNTRTGLGGFADRIGAFAYALTPFSILLSNRESVLSLMTGVPYQHFKFLHRWLGYIIFLEAALHTLGWTIVEGNLYQPQPTTYATFVAQQYAIFGCVALGLLTLMVVLSTKAAIRYFGYEVFRIGHWFLAVLYIGACWGHWDKLWCWMVAALTLMVLDQSIRGLRMLYLHLSNGQASGSLFQCASAKVQAIDLLSQGDDTVVRLDFDYNHRTTWKPGQHFNLCFPSLSIWQSYPFTPSSLASPWPNRMQHHTYILRVRSGQTASIAARGSGATVPVILAGPYGRDLPTWGAQNVLAVAGGTGITFILPVVREALRVQKTARWAIELVWVIRRAQDLLWLSEDVEKLQELAVTSSNLKVRIFVTRENGDERNTLSRVASPANSCSSLGGNNNGVTEKETMRSPCKPPRGLKA